MRACNQNLIGFPIPLVDYRPTRDSRAKKFREHGGDTGMDRGIGAGWRRAAAMLAVLATAAAAHAAEVPAAPAADAGVDSEGDIIVTARRREERAQDVPIALSVVGQAQLEATGNFTLTQIQQLVPALQVFSFNPRNTNVNIRGFGSNVAIAVDGLENGVGFYIDQVYYGRVGTSQFDLVDLDRIEVLRGPQGTLFGKNTTAGAINITSRLPSFTPEFSGEATLGDHGYHQVRGSASAPLIADRLAVRLSVADTHRDGFVRNVRTDRRLQDYDNFTVRGQLLATPTDRLQIRLIGDLSRQRLNCCISIVAGVFDRYDNGNAVPNSYAARIARAGYVGVPVDAFARRTDADSPIRANMSAWGFSGQVDWDLGRAALTSVTAYRRWTWDPANDSDAIGLPILTEAYQANRQRQFSQELRLASTGSNPVDYVVGLYYFRQIVYGTGAVGYGAAAANWFLPTVPAAVGGAALNGFHASAASDPETRSYAGFAQSTWHATERLSLTAGLRFTHENKDGSYSQTQDGGVDPATLPAAFATAVRAIRNGFNPNVAFSARRRDDSLSGTATVSYAVAPDALAYASYSRGNKSGGLNLAAIPAGVPTTVRPEKVDNYEVGLKSQFVDRTVTLNLAGFWTDVRDYQTAILDTVPGSVGTVQYIANIPRARSRGAEADARWAPTRLVALTASAAYTDGTYRSYVNGPAPVESGVAVADLSGRRLAGVAKFSYALGADAAQPVGDGREVYGHADWSHRSSFYTAVGDSRFSRVAGYGLLNLRAGLRAGDQRWDVSVWARNVLDKDYFQTLSPANTGLVLGITGDPRTLGATFRTKI